MGSKQTYRGPRDAIAAALCEHRRDLRAFVSGRVPSSDVEDVLQTAAARALEKSESLADASKVLPWLYRLHRNIVVDATRHRARRRRLIDDEATDAADLPAPPQPNKPCGCSKHQMQRLRPTYASILALVDIGGASLQEAARALEITADHAAVRIHRARKSLRKTMEAHCGVKSPRECADCRCAYDGCCAA